ncbi:hypothetical protein LG634_03880 [Streptomyces bambusae]|uniref:hypothetical protein n=1 Tax=Streptomyces bambusae TaxID=1550616 RepID=UPI001CFECA84|nr:hypothetical protein [Streptomyces bambusae]MCB5163974.1 hypothetical protein [Streptomyces bambusae]
MSGSTDESWQLRHQDELLGDITIDDSDFPWLHGRFTPTPAFAPFKPWFDESLSLLRAKEYERFEAAYDRIEQTLTLLSPSPTGRTPVAEFLLHIRDDRAWFRWSDEPFEDD